MRHRVSVQKLNKTPAHRKAMFKNMLLAFYTHERIKSTHSKCKVLKRIAEKLVTRARTDTLHNRRIVRKWIQDKAILNKLFTDIAPRYVQKPGGYTRITKIGPRYGDAAPMVYLSFVKDDEQVQSSTSKKKKKSVHKPPVTPTADAKNTSDKKKEPASTHDEPASAEKNKVQDNKMNTALETKSTSKVKASKDNFASTSLKTQKSRKTIPKK